jgi:hypothetical protein
VAAVAYYTRVLEALVGKIRVRAGLITFSEVAE